VLYVLTWAIPRYTPFTRSSKRRAGSSS